MKLPTIPALGLSLTLLSCIPLANAGTLITGSATDNGNGTYTYSYLVNNHSGAFDVFGWSLDFNQPLTDWNMNDVASGGDVNVPSGWLASAGIPLTGLSSQDFLSLSPSWDVRMGEVLGGFSFSSTIPPRLQRYYAYGDAGQTISGTTIGPMSVPEAGNWWTIYLLLGVGFVILAPRRPLSQQGGRETTRRRPTRPLAGIPWRNARYQSLLALALGTFFLIVAGAFQIVAASPPPVQFSPHVDYLVGKGPQFVAVHDLNHDGIPDLVVVNTQVDASHPPGDIAVLLGLGDGTFQAAVHYGVGREPSSAVVGDFNGDGIPDLAISSTYSDSVSILLGVGDGTFLPAVDYFCGFLSTVVGGDFNQDGILDLAVQNSFDKTVSVLLGVGNGTFAPRTTFPTGAYPAGGFLCADFNHDGHLDLLTVDQTSASVSLLKGRGDGTFVAPAQFAAGAGPNGLTAGDFNGDGNLDCAVTGAWDNSLSILLGKGDGTFLPRSVTDLGTRGFGLTSSDFNGDGNLDLAIPLTDINAVQIHPGLGNGTFGTPVRFATGPQPLFQVTAADLNGDGIPDLVVPCVGNGAVSILLGRRAPTILSHTMVPTRLHAGDRTPTAVQTSLNVTGGYLLVDLRPTAPQILRAPLVLGGRSPGQLRWTVFANLPLGLNPKPGATVTFQLYVNDAVGNLAHATYSAPLEASCDQFGAYGPSSWPTATDRCRSSLVIEAGLDLSHVARIDIPSMFFGVFDGPGGTFVSPYSGPDYDYVLQNHNDGCGNTVLAGVVLWEHFGSYGPSSWPYARSVLRAALVKSFGRSLVKVSRIDVLRLGVFDGPGGTVLSSKTPTGYTYCIENHNDGNGNSVKLGIVEFDAPTQDYDYDQFGSYGPCTAPLAQVQPRSKRLIETGKTLDHVARIDVLFLGVYDGPGGTFLSTTGTYGYDYCLENHNDGCWNSVKLGVVTWEHFGSYGPSGPGALPVLRAALVDSFGRSLVRVSRIDVLYLGTFDGPGGTVLSATTPPGYSYCIENHNDGNGNSVKLGIVEF